VAGRRVFRLHGASPADLRRAHRGGRLQPGVVGLLEVVAHIPRIYREYRKLLAAAREQKPDLAILTDSPDFHLPVARRSMGKGSRGLPGGAAGVAWRKGRLKAMRRTLRRLLCIFPFEEAFFFARGSEGHYIGHRGRAGGANTQPRGVFFETRAWPRAVH